jgi:amino acid transporter
MGERDVTSSGGRDDAIDTARARREKSKLRVVIGRMDGLALIVCALVGFDAFGKLTSEGAQAITWLVFMGVVFFVPYALVCTELGTAFPVEGGPYIWVKLAFGRFTAALASLLYWISNPIWLGGTLTITAVVAFDSFFTPLHGLAKYAFSLVFIWVAVAATVLSFDVGRFVLRIGAWVRVALVGGFSVTAVLYALRHGVHGVRLDAFSPSMSAFVATTPIVFFALVGFELPSEAGEELRDARADVPVNIARAAGHDVDVRGAGPGGRRDSADQSTDESGGFSQRGEIDLHRVRGTRDVEGIAAARVGSALR